MGIELDGANQKVIIDADSDTYLQANTDDTLDIYIAGAKDFVITANTLTAESGSTVAIAAGGALTNAGSMAPDITSTGKALVFGF
jgi:hypothetical protein|tara:strand:- start:549 stop:803 length:255 start_codon:yes stop_codon:yes gene_type:complete